MDIEFKYGRKKRRVVMVVGVALAAAAFAGVLMTTSAPPAVADVPMKNVIIAVADIPPRTVIDESMLAPRTIADDPSLSNVYADSTEILGRMSAVQIYAQQPLTPNLFANSLAGTAFSILEPGEVLGADTPEWRAISVSVEKARAVGGMLEVGQHVDLIVNGVWNVTEVPTAEDPAAGASPAPGAGEAPGGEDSGAPPGTGGASNPLMPENARSTKVTLQSVQILAKDPSTDIYVLKVNLHQAEQIAHLNGIEGNSFTLALRSDGDYRPADIGKYGETTDRIVWQYNFPVPQFIDLDQYPRTSPAPGPWDPNATPAPSATPAPAPSIDPNASPAPSPEPSASPAP